MKIAVIVNPKAGRRVVQKELETIIGRLLIQGIASDIQVTATAGDGDARRRAETLKREECDLIIGCGGDGTMNEIVHGLMKSGSKIPLAILAAGTSNDFAVSQRLPQNAAAFCDMVQHGVYQPIDIGLANGYYFINVAAFGMFTEVAHKTDREAKGVLGRLAYYLTGAKMAPSQLFKIIPVSIRSEEYEMDGDIRLCLIGNSRTVATMPRLLRKAEIDDGKFDVFLLRKRNLMQTDTELLKYISSGEFTNDPAVVYFQTKKIQIDSPIADQVELDLDGEYRGKLPLTVEVCHHAITLLTPAEKPVFSSLLPWFNEGASQKK